jgi:hypothetical protein
VYTLSDPRVEIDPDFMERLNEADRGQLLFRIVRGDEELAFACHELRVLAQDEWAERRPWRNRCRLPSP